MESWLVPLAEGLLELLFLGFFLWFLPYSPPPSVPAHEIERLTRRAEQLELLSYVPLIPLTVLCTNAWTNLFFGAARLRDSLMPAHRLLLPMEPGKWLWLLPGFFFGLLSGIWLSIALFRWWLGPTGFREFRMGASARAGIDTYRAMKWLTIAISAVMVPFTVLSLDWYTRLEQDRIVINEFWSLGERSYSYNQVTRIIETTHLIAPNGNLVERTRQFVVFDDGRQWCHDNSAEDPKPLLDLLTEKTGKSVQQVKFFEDAIPQ